MNKKDKGNKNKTKEYYVRRTPIYHSHIGTQQINSSGTAYLLMCLAANTVNRSFINNYIHVVVFFKIVLHLIFGK